MAKRKRRRLPARCRKTLAVCKVGRRGKLYKCRRIKGGKKK